MKLIREHCDKCNKCLPILTVVLAKYLGSNPGWMYVNSELTSM